MLSERAQDLFKEIRRVNFGGLENFSLEKERRQASEAGILTGEPAGVRFEETSIAGLRTIIAEPALQHPRRKLIFLHGGAFTMMSPETHQRFAGHIAKACRCEVFIPEFCLAPEFPFPAALEECVRFTRHFSESQQYAGAQVVLSGDSAGRGWL